MKRVEENGRVFINAASSSMQVVFVGIVYLLLYKFLLGTIGAAQLGIWSLVLATSSIANLANLGITSGMVKFIADYHAKNELYLIGKTVYTAVVSIVSILSPISIIILLSGSWVLRHIVHGPDLELAVKVLPFSIICLLTNTLGGVFTSVIEGLQKNYIRNLLYAFSALLLLFCSYQLVPRYGLIGVAYAQVIQAFFVLATAFFYSLKFYSGTVFFRWSWSSLIFKKLFNYGIKFQTISIAQMLYEPTTKLLLGKLAGLHFLGFYEMATRLVSQLRSVIVSANQVIVPVIAHANLIDAQRLTSIYKRSMSLLLFVNMVSIISLVIATPLISVLWIGDINKIFIASIYILSGSMFINIMCGPSYFSFLGEGNLNVLLKVHIVMAFVNIGVGYLLGKLWGGNGVVLAWSITLALGSIWCIFSYQQLKKIKLSSVLSVKDILVFIAALVITLMYCVLINNQSNHKTLILYFIFAFVLLMPLFFMNSNTKFLIKKVTGIRL